MSLKSALSAIRACRVHVIADIAFELHFTRYTRKFCIGGDGNLIQKFDRNWNENEQCRELESKLLYGIQKSITADL